MADAKKCDRCGRFYVKNTAHPCNYRQAGRMIAGVCICTADESIDESFDFCDKCISKFIEFMKGGKDE